ncbi:hypothetical protein PMAYCL1PPCAC_30572, partial [Pristionchus mayeri]
AINQLVNFPSFYDLPFPQTLPFAFALTLPRMISTLWALLHSHTLSGRLLPYTLIFHSLTRRIRCWRNCSLGHFRNARDDSCFVDEDSSLTELSSGLIVEEVRLEGQLRTNQLEEVLHEWNIVQRLLGDLVFFPLSFPLDSDCETTCQFCSGSPLQIEQTTVGVAPARPLVHWLVIPPMLYLVGLFCARHEWI